MKIYTKTGDKGKTSLFSMEEVKKDNIRVEAYGTIDELNSFIGHAKHDIEEDFKNCLLEVQAKLFTVGGILASYSVDYPFEITKKDVEKLEKMIDNIMQRDEFPKMDKFVIPGSSLKASRLHIARTVCRRAERIMVSLMQIEDIEGESLKYINRLSDLLFAMAYFYEINPDYYEPDKDK